MPYVPNPSDPTKPLDSDDRSYAAAEFRALKAYILQQVSQLTALLPPIGSMMLWSGRAADIPANFIQVPLVATTVNRATYPALTALYTAAGFPYGAGDGATTMGIPYIAADGTALAANANLGSVVVSSQVTAGGVTPAPTGGTRLYWILRVS